MALLSLLLSIWQYMHNSDENKLIRIAKCDVFLGACESV